MFRTPMLESRTPLMPAPSPIEMFQTPMLESGGKIPTDDVFGDLDSDIASETCPETTQGEVGGQMFRALLGSESDAYCNHDVTEPSKTPDEEQSRRPDDEKPEALKPSKGAWKPKREEPAVRAMQSILNKLTMDKFDTLYDQLKEHVSTATHVEKLVSLVFEKAIQQHNFIPMYADLVAKLHKWLQMELPVAEVQGDAFRKMLLDQCQVHFERFLEPIPQGPSEEDELRRQKLRTQMIGNGKLLGELLGRALVPSVVLFEGCNVLFDQCTESTLETAAALLTAMGPHLDNANFRRREQLEQIFARVKSLIAMPGLGPRPRCLLQDVLDLRARGWVKSIPAPAPAPVRRINMQTKQVTTISLSQGLSDHSWRAGPSQVSTNTWRGAPSQDFTDKRRGGGSSQALQAGINYGGRVHYPVQRPSQGTKVESWRAPVSTSNGALSPGLSIVNILKSLPEAQKMNF